MSAGRRWSCLLIVGLALVLRVLILDLKPAHFDEGVNGSFIDGMQTKGCYEYDPANYHGPLHFYVLFTGQQLFGRSLWVLRMPVALISAATVALMLTFHRFLPWRVVWPGAVAMAISPAMVFCSRYAIHESWLPFFSMLATYGGFAIARGEKRMNDLWALGLGLAGMVLTKETYLVHWIAALLALFAARFLGPAIPALSRRRDRRPADLFSGHTPDEEDRPQTVEASSTEKFTAADITRVTFVCGAVIVLFYSGFFLHWPGVAGILETFHLMAAKATTSEAGHNKEFFYWLKLLAWYEWPALAGLLAAPIISIRRTRVIGIVMLAAGALLAGKGFIALHAIPEAERATDYLRPHWDLDVMTSFGLSVVAVGFCVMVAAPSPDPLIRWLGLYVLGTLTAYALIPYKTPWCIINMLWPCFFMLGGAVDRLCRIADQRIVYSLVAMLAVVSFTDAWRLNFRNPTHDGDRYAYVQTTFDINKLLRPVRELVKITPLHRQMRGLVMTEAFPLNWELGDFPNVSFPGEDATLENYDADFLLVPNQREEAVEAGLVGIYFKERYRPRGGLGDAWLYLAAECFREVMPNREPEFRPRIPQPNPAVPPDDPSR